MSNRVNAADVLDREFLVVRSRLIDLAAALDRIGRAGSPADDPRWQAIRQSLQVLAGDQGNRAEQIQLIFSLPYEENWPPAYGL